MDRNPVRIVKNPSKPENVALGSAKGGARPVTAAWLERAALHYLDRHAASTEMLRRLLTRRVEKRARDRDEDPAIHAGLIAEVVARATRAGLVDDTRFAGMRLRRLRRRGTSTRTAGAALAARGVDRAVVEAVLAEEHEEAGEGADVEQTAAAAYARRRRLGPHRPPERRSEFRERDLAAMGRAGFPYGIARRVIDADRDEPDQV